jgi:hypothetical protein
MPEIDAQGFWYGKYKLSVGQSEQDVLTKVFGK